MRALGVAVLAAAFASPAAADEAVMAVRDAVTIELDGGTVRLAGVRVPAADGARAFVEGLLRGRRVTVAPGAPLDRHGRRLAQVERDDGLWLQGELLRRGLALVSTRIDSRERASEMLAIEQTARTAGLGLWATPQVQSAASVRPNGFRIVEGTVAEAARRRGRLYLNFGTDWRTDFTVAIAGGDLKRFKAAGLDPATLAGRRIRVRGWVENYNGSFLDADHPEQIELLDAPAPNAGSAASR